MRKVPVEVIKRNREYVDEEREPNTFEYLIIHGEHNAIPELCYDLQGKTKEEVYQYCLENNVEWQDVLKRFPDDVLT